MQGNLIGVDATGAAGLGNTAGIALGGAAHVVGGAAARGAQRHLRQCVRRCQRQRHRALIRGNYIGTNAAGTAAIAGNASNGIRVLVASGITIGGIAAGEGNLVSGNGSAGIATDDTSSAVTIQGNKVGTNAAGTAAVANGGGVSLAGDGHSSVAVPPRRATSSRAT